MVTKELVDSINQSVLCWLATSSSDNIPNVSPKEIFALFENKCIIIANIASPQSKKNLEENNAACVSFIDIFTQKGFQIKGIAEIINDAHPDFQKMQDVLLKMTKGLFPFTTIFKISIDQKKKIIAPRYIFYPETTEVDQIESAKKSYSI